MKARLETVALGMILAMPLIVALACDSQHSQSMSDPKVTDSGDSDQRIDESDSDDLSFDKDLVVGYPGAGTAGANDPLRPGVGPETCEVCSARTVEVPEGIDQSDVLEQTLDCFYGAEDIIPAAAIEQLVEVIENGSQIHVRITFDPRFVDNTYGKNSIGWEDTKKGIHQFKDLVGSDHVEVKMFDSHGGLVLHFKVDYLSEVDDAEHPSGYGTLGVRGGDGKMIVGDASAILAAATSLDRNLNGCGLGGYIEDSPKTDDKYTPDPAVPAWDFRVVYEVWVDAAPFGEAGFGDTKIESVHASPSKMGSNTIIVVEGECPSDDEEDEDDCNPKLEDCDDGWSQGPI